MLLKNLSHENLDKSVIKYIYNDKVSTTLTGMRAQKWKNMKNRKAKSFARIGPDVDSNFHRNERVMYYAHVLLNFQNPASPIRPINHGCQILNGPCMPIMHLIIIIIIIIIIIVIMSLMMNCLSESNSTKHLLTIYLSKSQNC